MESQQNNRVGLEFKGTGFQALGWGLIAILLYMLIIPAAWGAVFIYRWFVRNLVFSDGTKASFEGRGGEIFLYFIAAALLGFLPQLANLLPEDQQLSVILLIVLVSVPLSVAIWLKILRWVISSIRLSCGTTLSFEATYGSYLGWTLLLVLSFFTIIGWAWVGIAMLRWVLRNIKGGEHEVAFTGTGWGFLWRYVLMALGCMLILPIPWLVLWVTRWFIRHTEIHRSQTT